MAWHDKGSSTQRANALWDLIHDKKERTDTEGDKRRSDRDKKTAYEAWEEAAKPKPWQT